MGYRGLGPLAWVLFAVATAGCTFCFSGCRAQDSQRELALSDFDFLELGMSFEDITDELGLPDRFTGSGLVDVQYDLDDGRIIELTFMDSRKRWNLGRPRSIYGTKLNSEYDSEATGWMIINTRESVALVA
jgi:hypothetical protein